MPYIYKITNDINNKIYIGKTLHTIEKRFQEHKKDCFKARTEKRPLYNAMQKYGVDHFKVELVEECSEDVLEEREKYWIEYYNSFKTGYNATIGGDGRSYIDYDLVVMTYKNLKSMREVAEKLHISVDTVSKILKLRNETIYSSQAVQTEKYGKKVSMFSLKNEYIQSFASMNNAAQYLIDNNLTGCKLSTIRTHISEASRGKRKTAAGYIWKLE